MKNVRYLSACLILCLGACKGGNASGNNGTNGTNASALPADTITCFTLPAVPVMLNTPEQRADFVVKHFWDHVNFKDTNYIHHPEITEQAWADYCDVLNHVPLSAAQEAMKKTITLSEAHPKVFGYFTDLADKYLYDPNSPLRNEEFYIPVLEAMIASPVLSETEKIRPKALLALARKNRPGTPARDFTYTLASGAQGTLYGVQAPYTLLFINNPGCHACAETLAQIKESALLQRLQEQGKLKVLSLYPDEELEEWRRHLEEFPRHWINGYDKSGVMREKQLYDLKAIPTLYLLDSKKTVLLKDTTVPGIEEFLN